MTASAGPRPQILFVALASGLGGSMRSLATLMEELGGFERVIACPGPSGFVELIEERGCVEGRLPLSSGEKGRLHARLGGALRLALHAWRHRKTLVAIHANGLSERNVVALAAAVSRRPVVVWFHEWTVSAWSRRLSRPLRILNPATRFVAVSEYSREMLAASGIAAATSIHVVANPIVREEIEPSRRPKLSRGPYTVGYLGAPASYKGFHLLPEVITELLGEPVRWVIYSGPRSAMAHVWTELESFPSAVVELKDKVLDVREAYAQCDIVYCPSLEESFGRVVAEAMASGVPVVASDLPAVREVLGFAEVGILVPPNDVHAAVAAIRRLGGDPDLREKMGRLGRTRAADFAPTRIARRMEAIYRLGDASARRGG